MANPGVPENGRARFWGDTVQRSARHPTMPHEEGALRADIVAFATVATWPSHRGATGAIRLGSEQQAPRANSAARGADLFYQASEKSRLWREDGFRIRHRWRGPIMSGPTTWWSSVSLCRLAAWSMMRP